MVRLLALLFLAACAGPAAEKRAGEPDADAGAALDTGAADDTGEPGPSDTAELGDGETGEPPGDTGREYDTGDDSDTADLDTADPDTADPDTADPDTADPDTGGAGGSRDTGDTGAPEDSDTGEITEPDTGDTDGFGSGPPPTLTGRTYRFNLREGALTEPPGIGGIFTSFIEDHLLVEVLAADDATLSLRWGWSDGLVDTQDTCAPTTDASADLAAFPAFETTPTDASLWAVEEMDAERATLSGTFASDGSTVDDATFSALAQTASLASLLGSRDPEAFCDLMASFGETCEPCADGRSTCMRFTFEGLTGVEISPLALTEVPTACR